MKVASRSSLSAINTSTTLLLALLMLVLPNLTSAKNKNAGNEPQGRARKATATKRNSGPTAADIQRQIRSLLAAPELKNASISLRVITKSTQATIFEQDAERLLLPASNMKIFTTIAALESLGPDFKVRTSVYARVKPDQKGQIVGDLTLYGRGDPTLASIYIDETLPFERLAQQMAQAGVKEITGDLIADESYFKGSPLGQGWEWLDLQWHFGTEISALSAHDNHVEVSISPGAKVGDSCVVKLAPDIGHTKVDNRLVTVAAGTKREIGLNRGLSDNDLLAWGQMAANDTGFQSRIAVHAPAELAGEYFRQALLRSGIRVNGKVRVADASLRSAIKPIDPEKETLMELAFVESPPLTELIKVVNKFSQNFYAEMLLRLMGRVKGPAELDSDEAGVEVIKQVLKNAKVDATGLSIRDGSGLSRRTLVNAAAITKILFFISEKPEFEQFVASLPLGGIDGTLAKRFNSLERAKRVQAKTGTLTNISALSGFVESRGGETLIFSFIINNFTENLREAVALEDKLCELLMSYSLSSKKP